MANITYAKHQLECSAFAASRPGSISAMSTGTGKSITSMLTMFRLLEASKVEKCLMCATKGSMPEIVGDFQNFYNYTPFHIYDNLSMEEFFKSERNIGIFRYEYFKKIPPDNFRYFLHNHKNALFIDEAQKLKNSGTQAHKYIKSIREQVDYFNLMTATPLMTSLDDLYTLMHLVDPRVLGDYKDFTKLYYEQELVPRYAGLANKRCKTCRSKMFFMSNGVLKCPRCGRTARIQCKYETISYKNMDILSSKLQQYMYCFYPKQDINYIVYKTPMFDFRKYINIAHDIFNENQTPHSTRMIELQRCTSQDINKIKLLAKVVKDVIHEGCIIYCAYLDSVAIVEGLLDAMGIPHQSITGASDDEDRALTKEWFKNGAEGKVLILTAAGGASLNLQVTPHFIFYELPWGVGAFMQAIGRICRMFSKYKKFFIHFVTAEHTIDEYKYEIDASYKTLTEGLLNNQYLPSGTLPDYNKKLIADLRRDLCWYY